MNTFSTFSRVTSAGQILRSIAQRNLALLLAVGAPLVVNAAEFGQSFGTPEVAFEALVNAARTEDSSAVRVVLGPDADSFYNPDRVQATNDYRVFVAAFNKGHRINRETETRCVLELGEDAWPFPIPVVKREGQWFFDSEAGREELLNRRIGMNELATLRSVRAYAEAQRDYAIRDRDGDQVLEYAQKINSSPGLKDGLFWPPDLDGEISPLGPLMGEAQLVGYDFKPTKDAAEPQPFYGYYYKVLTRQAKSAPGGKYDYIINGNMIGGFALVAWPAEYGDTGVMTFIVNQQGRVYQKDLGPKTAKTAVKLSSYDPDKTWTISHD